MAVVAVTGGTGTLGRHLVPQLVDAGHQVRVLTRREGAAGPPSVEVVRGDVRLGTGLDALVAGADAVVHAASSPWRRVRQTEVEGTANVLHAATGSGSHVIYVSIVGVDRHRFAYYRAKRDAEELMVQHPGPWTIQRLTQFHELLDRLLGGVAFVRTPSLTFQPQAALEAAATLVAHVSDGPAGRAADVGGPEVLDVRRLAETRRRIAGRAARLVPVPSVGPLADFDAGIHLCPDRAVGQVAWEAWLREQHAPDE